MVPNLRWVLSWLALAVSAAAQTSLLPPGGVVAMNLLLPDATYATRGVLNVPGEPFAQAVRVQTLKTPANDYDIQLNVPASAAVAQGDVIQAIFWLRRATANGGEAVTEFIFEQAGSPYVQSVGRVGIEGDGQWTKVSVAFTAADNYAAGQSQMNFRLGFGPQIIDLGGFTVTNYAKTLALSALPNVVTYSGRSTNAAWRAPAAARIEQLRKANLTVRARDAAGYPVPGAEVRVEMRRHAFGFGSAVNGPRLLSRTAGTLEDRARYQQVITNWFNKAVLENDLKWPDFESDPATATNALNWLLARGLAVRGHNLIWPGTNQSYMLPADVPKLFNDPAALRARINQHFTNILTATKGKCVEWDVINEPYAEHVIMDILGYGEMVSWFKLARALDPAPVLFLNEYGNLENAGLNNPQTDDFFNKLSYLQTNGAPIGGAGFQSHFQSYLSPPDQVVAQLDRFGALGLAMEATEFDIDVTDEAAQADYLHDFMTAMFSHPGVNGIVMWGFWEGQHWRPNAALFRQNWDLKPNGVTWSNLVFHEWWTSTNLVTDTNGIATARGFKGDYDVTVMAPGQFTNQLSATLLEDAQVNAVVTPLRPVLTATRSGDNVDFAWPGSSAGFHLEFSPGLSPASWQPVAVAAQWADGRWTARVQTSAGEGFFRLSR